MAFGGVGEHFEPERVTRTFVRVRRGYDPPAVDAHLAVVREGVERLHRALAGDSDESLDLVLQATRRSIDDALEDARSKADAIISEAEVAATARVRDAEAEAEQLVAQGRDQARHNDEAARERYVELGRLLEVRRLELDGLDEQIAQRQQVLRRAAQDLRSLADGMPRPDDASAAPNGASHHDERLTVPDGVELHFPEQVATDA